MAYKFAHFRVILLLSLRLYGKSSRVAHKHIHFKFIFVVYNICTSIYGYRYRYFPFRIDIFLYFLLSFFFLIRYIVLVCIHTERTPNILATYCFFFERQKKNNNARMYITNREKPTDFADCQIMPLWDFKFVCRYKYIFFFHSSYIMYWYICYMLYILLPFYSLIFLFVSIPMLCIIYNVYVFVYKYMYSIPIYT